MCDDLTKCGGCAREITKCEVKAGRVVKLIDSLWHVNHIFCVFCEVPIHSNKAYRSNVDRFKPCCRDCYIMTTHPSCAVCAQPVQETAVTAFNSFYHHKCFRCVNCKKVIGRDSGYYENNGAVYDAPCWMRICREKYV